MIVDIDHAGLPLASAIINFYPFIVFYIKRMFENMFDPSQSVNVTYVTKDAKVINNVEIVDPKIQFSDDIIKSNIKEFVYGYSNRLKPIVVKMSDGKEHFIKFKGRNVTAEQLASGDFTGESPLINRRLTWCDMLYMAATEACRDKYVLITRFPMDTYFNQFSTKVRITTLKNTENIMVNSTYYPFYPKIREKDIGCNTSNMFSDTLTFSNLFLKSIVGDYDGDQCGVKAAWTVEAKEPKGERVTKNMEANEELKKMSNSKSYFIDLGATNIKVSTNEAIQSLYSLTKVLDVDKDKLTDPVF